LPVLAEALITMVTYTGQDAVKPVENMLLNHHV